MAANTSGRSRKGIGGGKKRPCPKCGSLERTGNRACKPCAKAYAKRYAAENRGRIAERETRRRRARTAKGIRNYNPAKSKFYSAKGRAKKYGIPFSLTLDFVLALVARGECEYCKKPLAEVERGVMNMDSPSLDKLIPSLGYTPENIVLACMDCNARKQNHTPESLRVLADQIERAIARNANKEVGE